MRKTLMTIRISKKIQMLKLNQSLMKQNQKNLQMYQKVNLEVKSQQNQKHLILMGKNQKQIKKMIKILIRVRLVLKVKRLEVNKNIIVRKEN